ncbi:hypothetical protein BH23ACT9_BH23ACT9_07830 [soil metagenome]
MGSPAREAPEAIGANVLRFRRALGWSQEHLATASGLSKGTIVAIEQQRSNPSVGTLCALSETLGVGLATLLEAQPLNVEGPASPKGSSRSRTAWRKPPAAACCWKA